MCLIKRKLATVLWTSYCLVCSFRSCGGAQTTVGTDVGYYQCPTSLSPGCFCAIPLFRETLGWLITCKDDNGNLAYTLQYLYTDPGNPSSDSQYVLFCVGSQPLAREFFRNFSSHGGEETRNVAFHNCTVPLNISLADVLDGLAVQSLNLECETCNADSGVSLRTPWTFHKLESLTLKNFNLSELPENVFGQLVSLKELQMNNDKIRDLPENLLFNQSKLEKLDLYDNHMESLPESLFRNLVVLKALNLKMNRIKEVNGKVLRYLTSLQTLDLSSNMIESLTLDAFQFNKELASLVLSENKLQAILPGTFANNAGLTFLDLRNNPALSDLPETMGEGIISLQEFNLSECNISTIPESILLNAHNLTRFEVFGNSLENIPSRLFASSFSLTSLDLSRNRIAYLPSGIFLNNTKLKFISFAFNRFTKFPSEELRNLGQLVELNLEGNSLSEFGNINGAYSLINISLQNNEIRTLSTNQPFGLASNLSFVDLSHNKLTEFLDLDWGFYPELKTLNLQYNEITILDVTTMSSLNIDVHLENNNISQVSVIHVEQANNTVPINHRPDEKQSIYLKDNPLHCDCHMLEFQRYVNTMQRRRTTLISDRKDLVCSSPSNLANASFVRVKEDDFVCPFEHPCPRECKCLLRAVFNSTEVSCVKQNLSELPSGMPENISVLDFQHNSLKSLVGFRDPLWDNLTTLMVADNKVTSEGLYFPEGLKSLSIQRNALTVVPSVLVTWSNTAQLLNLEGNPWRCDCNGLALKQLLADSYRIIPDRNKVLCAKPASLFQMSVGTLHEKDICPNNKNNSGVYITALSVCVPLIVVMLILSVVYLRNRKVIIAYTYIHCYKIFLIFFRESDVDEDKPFHAFVSYSSSDRDVMKALVEELEKKEPYFRLCIHERDWLPGQLITWNIVRSVQNSRRTILVLSRDFLKSVWFQLEFHIAYYQMMEDKMDRLIVVVNGDLPGKADLDGDLQFLLSTKSYLIWNERWFWEKLRYALPHKKGPSSGAPPKRPELQCPSSELLQKIEGKIMSLTQKTVECVPQGPDKGSVELEEVNRNGQAGHVLLPDTRQTDSSSV